MSNHQLPTDAQYDDYRAAREAIMPDYCQVILMSHVQQPGGDETLIPEIVAEYPCTYDATRSEEVILPQGTRIQTEGAFYLPRRAYGTVKSIHSMRLVRQGKQTMNPPIEVPVAGEPEPTHTQLVVHVKRTGG